MSESFIPVGALGEGFAPDANVLEETTDLAGRTFALSLDAPVTLRIGEGTASWGGHTDVPVRVTSIRTGVYLVDGVADEVSTTFVLDVGSGAATLVEGRLPDAATRAEAAYTRVRRGAEPTGVTARIVHGGIDGPAAVPHAPTADLVGLRTRYTYSPNEVYEHIYLTPDLYTWHCLRGVEKGLADTDRCHHVAIRDRLTLFVWREKIVPTLGLVLIDLDGLRTDGKIFGNDTFDEGSIVNFPVGARADILNFTAH
ncbi:molybdenum cofactor biosynthesis protein F [Prauserella shujinwangii]|uniref:Molybdenum cofactor biosynthesis protein F n=1 Tax=Prauserella shujinwangii TaxID=1453103 RepID=A0A2T0LZ25_9PSEU|nr:MoaF C-terminal domain-containing protein [Prauserella shujinwangii]PRX49368.1 molybdenum cofactor biosynthesis protein F [Prauserella shujinwangii]